MAVDVGHRFPERTFTVEPLRVEEFVTALGVDPSRDYVPEEGAPVPIGFLMYVTTYGAHPVHEALEVDFMKAVYGGAEYEFHAPIRVGDTLRVAPEVTDKSTKRGSQGVLTFIEITCDYVLPDGTLALRERSTTIERE